MRIGVAKEIKTHEYRVALTPAGAHVLEKDRKSVVEGKTVDVGSGLINTK